MRLKTVEEHYDATKPIGWCRYAENGDQWRGFAERFVDSVREEIASALREALRLSDGCKIEGLIEYAGSLRIAYESVEAAKKIAEVAVETADERNGRLERDRFWNGKAPFPWHDECPNQRDRWIAYAKTINRPKVSPGQRLYESFKRIYKWSLEYGDAIKHAELESEAKSLGITECDA